jgi:hypothetical protein
VYCTLSISYLACTFNWTLFDCAKIFSSEYTSNCYDYNHSCTNCSHFIFDRPVESRGIHQSGTMGEMVTYRYYVGRLNMFEDQYELAEENFDYALKHCHRSAVGNKKRILNYLVPVKLLRGRLPTSRCECILVTSPFSFTPCLICCLFNSTGEVFPTRVCTSHEWYAYWKLDRVHKWIDEEPRHFHQVSVIG